MTVNDLEGFSPINAKWEGAIPLSIPLGEYYVGAIIDQYDEIEEYIEYENNCLFSTEILQISSPFFTISIIAGISTLACVVVVVRLLDKKRDMELLVKEL